MIVATLKNIWLEIGIVLLLIIVSAMTGYEIGFNTAIDEQVNQPTAMALNKQNINTETNKNSESVIRSIAEINSNTQLQPGATDQFMDESRQFVTPEYEVVYGSINGTKYYNYGCKSGDRIKVENRIYFADEAKALLQGYEPSVNCDF